MNPLDRFIVLVAKSYVKFIYDNILFKEILQTSLVFFFLKERTEQDEKFLLQFKYLYLCTTFSFHSFLDV